MNIDVNSLALPASTKLISVEQTKTKPPRHRSNEKFLKGPIPLEWLCRAAQLPGQTIHIALAMWFLAGLTNSSRVKLSQKILNDMNVNRFSKYRALKHLANANLIEITCEAGCAPVINILEFVRNS